MGPTAGLVDYTSDRLTRPTTRTGRLKATAITFLPPLCLSLLFLDGFTAMNIENRIPLSLSLLPLITCPDDGQNGEPST
ncbi:aromatic amino acid transport family protein [Pantoea agglomerans]|uniref:aromatic amino acid transport family protein n=1 Tax=Enterobacter agglomerans TaxID=549 RepID=UPI0009C11A95|nr:aromatic amino acid transport family protein [Pantoea agglomerans]